MGHPDKLADRISDGVLDAIFAAGSERPRCLRNDGDNRYRRNRRRDHDRCSSCRLSIKSFATSFVKSATPTITWASVLTLVP